MRQWQIGKNTPSVVELEDILRRYPWFSAGHRQMFLLKSEKGADYSSELIRKVAPYLYSCEDVVKEVRRRADTPVQEEVAEAQTAPSVVESVKEREIFVVGGDYFGKEDYQMVKGSGDNYFDSYKEALSSSADVKAKVDKSNDHFSDDEYCTETLAKIYLSQGCLKRAIEVYDKLILLYPEKSTYFATLKEEIKKQL